MWNHKCAFWCTFNMISKQYQNRRSWFRQYFAKHLNAFEYPRSQNYCPILIKGVKMLLNIMQVWNDKFRLYAFRLLK